MVDFSVRLKQLRKDKHLTQAQVAKRIGVTASMVSSYETDIRLPSFDVMVRIADLFGVTVDFLLCRENKRFIDISQLSEEEATVVCNMVEILKKRSKQYVGMAQKAIPTILLIRREIKMETTLTYAITYDIILLQGGQQRWK